MSIELETREELPMIDAQIVRYQPAESLAVVREPEQVLADAQKAAAALMKVVSSKKKQISFNGETYLESGDWQTVAKFYGVTAKIESTKFVTYGEASGFEAAAVALDCNGRVVSRGEAMCLNDEENWGMRARYEWQDILDENGNKIWEPNPNKPGKNRPKSKRVKIGEEPTPLFQLRSMAQTRACAKALSNLFKWVVVLAGYKPTPADEMTSVIQNGSDAPDYEPDLPSEKISSQPLAKQTVQPPTQAPAASQGASQGQERDPQQYLYAILAGTTLTCTPLTITEKKRTVPKTEENPEGIQPYIFVLFKGNVKTISEFSCFDTGLFEAIRAGLNRECQFKVEVKEKSGKTYINVKDALWIDGEEYVDGKPLSRYRRNVENSNA